MIIITGHGEVPTHLRDAHYSGAQNLGHGKGYDYPHDHEAGWVAQQYRPAHLEDRVYYEPSTNGHEAEIARRMQDLRPTGAEPQEPEDPS